MRIISGKHKGRRIEFPKEALDIIRPTSEYAREAIFNILTHGKYGLNGQTFDDKHVLDAFCGTGAFGLEALSRGAKSVTFVDQARESLATAKHNTQRINEMDNAEFLLANATKLPKARKAYDVVFLDPPYFSKLIGPTLESLRKGGWIAEDGMVVVEHDIKEILELPESYTLLDGRRYGRAVIEILQLS
ncbi:MAG: 16S rRNA (guanine(966)-N(2))-methyltransferase RsmD [Rickettsiales bacterium]